MEAAQQAQTNELKANVLSGPAFIATLPRMIMASAFFVNQISRNRANTEHESLFCDEPRIACTRLTIVIQRETKKTDALCMVLPCVRLLNYSTRCETVNC